MIPRPSLPMLTGAQHAQIDNAVRPAGPRKITGWRLVGASYKRGRRIPGATILELEGRGIVYYPEEVSLQTAVERAQTERGYDTREIRERIARWVTTGDPNA